MDDTRRYRRRDEPLDDYDDLEAAYTTRLHALGYGSDYMEYDAAHADIEDRLGLPRFGRRATGLHSVRSGSFVGNGLLIVVGLLVLLVVASITIANYAGSQPHTLNLSNQPIAGGAATFAPDAATPSAAPSDADARPLGPPVNADGWRITKTYAEHFGPGPYGAIDIAFDPRTSWGAPLIATHSGIVHLTTGDPLYGNKIRVVNDHFMTQYGHLQGFKATEGQSVRRGDIIGYMGSTGNSSGPHVDYQVWQDGKNQNPMNFLK